MSEAASPRYQDVPLASLTFDPENPRFPSSVDGRDISKILEFMLDDAGLTDLMGSIAAQGFFPGEPLLVCEGVNASFEVVEGNRRLAASYLLTHPDEAPIRRQAVLNLSKTAGSIETLPCLIFEKRSDILQYLGYRHVTGIKEWEPLAKARFLSQRYSEVEGDLATRLRSVARTIGSRSDYVGRLLSALALYRQIERQRFFNIKGLDEVSLSFSLITSVLAYENIVWFLGLDSSRQVELNLETFNIDNLAQLTGWLFERNEAGRTVVGESRNIRKLADVVVDERALSTLRRGANLETAYRLATGAEEFRGYLTNAKDNLQLAEAELEGVTAEAQDVDLADAIRLSALAIKRRLARQLEEDEK